MLEAAWSAVLRAICDGATAWSTAEELSEAVGCVDYNVCDILYELQSNGMVEAWGSEPGAPYTLTPFAADGLNVHLVEYGLVQRLRWAHATPTTARARVKRRRADDEHDEARVIDPSPGPSEIAESNDEIEKHWKPGLPLTVDDLPRPTNLVMGCDPDWTEVNPSRRGEKPPACRACKGRRLKPLEYCLRCTRWGLDGLLARRRRAELALAAARDAG